MFKIVLVFIKSEVSINFITTITLGFLRLFILTIIGTVIFLSLGNIFLGVYNGDILITVFGIPIFLLMCYVAGSEY